MKADKGKHRADVISKLDLLLKNVGGRAKINSNQIDINQIAASTVDKLATVPNKTLKEKLVYHLCPLLIVPKVVLRLTQIPTDFFVF